MARKLEKGESRWIAEFMHQAWDDRGMPMGVYQSFMWAAENMCESPIERRMLAALHFCPFGYYEDLNRIVSPEECAGGLSVIHDGAVIIPQMPFHDLGYRVDFLVILNTRHTKVSPDPKFIVECDGHDFHEKTKEQAARDKKRDRDLQALGIPVFRFTGSEIHNKLDDCVSQLDGYGAKLLEKIWDL